MPKHSTDLKRFEVSNLGNIGIQGAIVTYREKDFDPYEPSKADFIEAEKVKNSTIVIGPKKNLNKLESITCHVCGNT